MLIFAWASASATRANMPGRLSRKIASCLVICMVRCLVPGDWSDCFHALRILDRICNRQWENRGNEEAECWNGRRMEGWNGGAGLGPIFHPSTIPSFPWVVCHV